MRIFASETLTVGPTTPVMLTPSVYDNTQGEKATVAQVTVYTSPVIYSFLGAPAVGSSALSGAGADFEIEGYDNLAQVQFLSLPGTLSSIVVNYGN